MSHFTEVTFYDKNKGVCTGADNSHRARLSAELVRRYHFLKRGVIGQSRCGREIEAFALGSEEESVLYCGAFHGMEWITSLLLYKYLDCVCAAADRGGCVSQIKLTRFLKRRGLVVIPCVNPDGVEISLHGAQSAGAYANLVSHVSGGKTAHWQANAAGVDLNHNYDAGWEALHKAEQKAGFVSPGPTRFGGKQPESEPETQAMCAFCRKTISTTRSPSTARVKKSIGISGNTRPSAPALWRLLWHGAAVIKIKSGGACCRRRVQGLVYHGI